MRVEVMEYMPLMIRLRNMRCLVVGGGSVACRKAKALLQYGVRLTVISPVIEQELKRLYASGLIRWKRKRFSVIDLFGCRLVVAATDEPKVNRRIDVWSKKLRILNNAVDDPINSNFIFPAIYGLEPLTIAVSTQGKAPALARKIRNELAEVYGPDYKAYLEAMVRLRTDVLKTESDAARRRILIEQGLTTNKRSILIHPPTVGDLGEGER